MVQRTDGAEWITNGECSACAALTRQNEQEREQQQEFENMMRRYREFWRANCGPQGQLGGKTFANFKRELNPKAFDALNDWQHGSLVLYSPDTYGVGKTHLACALANKLIDNAQGINPYPVYFCAEVQMLSRIRATFNRQDENAETEDQVYDKLLNFGLLIVDDVGKVRPRDPSFLQDVYLRVLYGRGEINGLPIILTTNLGLEGLETHIGGASADRLRGMCGEKGFIRMAGKSQRH